MEIETEAKILLEEEEFEIIKKNLGESYTDYEQENSIYDLKNGFLRIRNEPGKTVLTVKGKRDITEVLNCREELNFNFPPREIPKLRKLAEFLGLKETLSYTKRRQDYDHPINMLLLNRCKVCLDDLPNGQKYIEIEGKSEDVCKNIENLGLKGKPIEHRSYQEILKEYQRIVDRMNEQ